MPLTSTSVINRTAFPGALASRAHRLGSDATIQTLIELSEAKILTGGGEVNFLLSGSGNGKTAMQECRMDAAELFTLANDALPLYLALVAAGGDPGGGAAVCCTYTDFSCLH